MDLLTVLIVAAAIVLFFWGPRRYWSVVALLAFAASADAQQRWGPRRGPVGSAAVRTNVALKWHVFGDEAALYRGSCHVGSYRFSDALYLPIVANEWSEPCDPPIAPPAPLHLATSIQHAPCACGPKCNGNCAPDCKCDKAPENFGIDLSGLSNEERIEISGRPATREEAIQAFEKGLPDDANKLRLTVIGTDAERKRFEADLAAPEMKDVRDRCLLWSVPPDHWSVQVGFVTSGHPTIYLTDKSIDPATKRESGQVLHRQDDYQGASDFQAIRKAIDSYDAKKDPDLRKPAVPGLDWFSKVPAAVWWVLAGLVGGFLLLRGKQ